MKTILFLVILLILTASSDVIADEDSRWSARIYIRGSRYGSDDGLQTGFYPAVNDSPSLYNAKNQMQYEYDGKMGLSVYGAVGYEISPRIETVLALGYTSMSMTISQRSNYYRNTYIGSDPGFSRYRYQDASDYDYSAIHIRPGINLLLSSGSWLIPYIGACLDIVVISGNAKLIFARPYVVEDGGQYELFIGEDALLEEYTIDGSQLLIGFGLEGGLDFRVVEWMSISLGFVMDLHFKKAFSDFDDLITDDDIRAMVVEYGCTNDSMEFTNVGVLLGLKFYL